MPYGQREQAGCKEHARRPMKEVFMKKTLTILLIILFMGKSATR